MEFHKVISRHQLYGCELESISTSVLHRAFFFSLATFILYNITLCVTMLKRLGPLRIERDKEGIIAYKHASHASNMKDMKLYGAQVFLFMVNLTPR